MRPSLTLQPDRIAGFWKKNWHKLQGHERDKTKLYVYCVLISDSACFYFHFFRNTDRGQGPDKDGMAESSEKLSRLSDSTRLFLPERWSCCTLRQSSKSLPERVISRQMDGARESRGAEAQLAGPAAPIFLFMGDTLRTCAPNACAECAWLSRRLIATFGSVTLTRMQIPRRTRLSY